MAAAYAEDDVVAAQVRFMNLTFQRAQSLALRSAILLRIPDILAEAGTPLSCEAILRGITANRADHMHGDQQTWKADLAVAATSTAGVVGGPSLLHLSRILRALATLDVFSAARPAGADDAIAVSTECLYGLTDVSRLMVTKNRNCMAALLLVDHEPDFLAPSWNHLHRSVLTGTDAFTLAHGKDLWRQCQDHPAHGTLFNEAMRGTTQATLASILPYYDGFKNMEGVITDVGGSMGVALTLILGKYPHLRGINFDLPHVIAVAPQIHGVENVSGDMFQAIPPSNAIFMRWILHDWDEEQCIQILRNCHKALPQDGKVILVESILRPDGNTSPDTLAVTMDLVMLAYTQGMEREEWQWRHIFQKAGFAGVRIIETGHFQQVLELSK